MNSDYEEIAEMLFNHTVGKNQMFKTLSSEVCDAVIPFGIISAFFDDVDLYGDYAHVRSIEFSVNPETRGIVDIINNSTLKNYLFADTANNLLGFSETLPFETRKELVAFLLSRNGGIA